MNHAIIKSMFFSCIWMIGTSLSAQELFDQSVLRTLSIDFYDDDYDIFLDDSWNDETKLRLPAKIDLDGMILDSVAVRYKGNSTYFIPRTRNSPKLPFNLDINKHLDQELLGSVKLKLANGYFDPSLIREAMAFDIYREYMPSPKANHLKVNVEGEYLGVYVNTETINKDFLKKHFDYKSGALFKCDPSSQFGSSDEWVSPDLAWYGPDSLAYYDRYELKSDKGWANFVNLLEAINIEQEAIEDHLNVDRYLWYAAVTQCIANYDSYLGLYVHNYYFYQHENGLWQIIPWDASEAFIGILLENEFVPRQALYEWDPFLEQGPGGVSRPLNKLISEHPVYRKQLAAHMRTVLEESIVESELRDKGNAFHEVIKAAAADDDHAFFGFGDTFLELNLESNIELLFLNVAGIINTAMTRKEYLEGIPELQAISPEIIDVVIPSGPVNPNEEIEITCTVEYADEVDLMISTNEWASHFQPIEMLPIGENMYRGYLPAMEAGTKVNYYVRAQNEEAMSLLPEKAEYEFFEIQVEESLGSTFEQENHRLIFYPNPVSANNLGNIKLINEDQLDFNEFRLYSALGLLMHTASYQNGLDLTGLQLAGGNYYVELIADNRKQVVSFSVID